MPGSLDWLVPTLRATRLRPSVLATALAVVIEVALHHLGGGGPSPQVAPLLSATLAGALVLGLDDPARDLLAAVPTGPGARLLHRLVPLAAVTVAAAVALAAVTDERSPGTGAVTAPVLVVLCATGVLVHLACARFRPDLSVTVGAVVPLAWVVWATATPAAGPLAGAARAWRDHPWLLSVLALSATLLLLGPVAHRSPLRTHATRAARP